ncbi:hypothetical protein HEP84_52450 [Streptomyces sp. RLB1-33]|nr:hypothetical protein [Streptomyces sp. RLB1-33]QIY76228.1 hypothetical protein HEP84_52450 [Streptomyces sp. RLB1-33]
MTFVEAFRHEMPKKTAARKTASVVDARGQHGARRHGVHPCCGRVAHVGVARAVDGGQDGRLDAGLANIDEHALGETVAGLGAARRERRGQDDSWAW